MSTPEVLVVLGIPASGKSSYALATAPDHTRLNRDNRGGTLADLANELGPHLTAGRSVVLDNTYATRDSRKPLIAAARAAGARIRCIWIDTSIEDAQVNAVSRMVQKHGRLLNDADLKQLSKKDPGLFGPGVLFRYRKTFEEPTAAEGFDSVERVRFTRKPQASTYTGRAVLLDMDGTVRKTKSGAHYPTDPSDVEILPGRRELLKALHAEGVKLLGVSNQSGISKGSLTEAQAIACFDRTVEMLGVPIEVSFCPHNPAPITCWCRKPMPGLGVAHIERHKLDRAKTTMVGDMTTDKTFATRLGVAYRDASDFFPR